MTTIDPLIPGIYARSERLVQTTRDHDRDRVDDDALVDDQRRDTENLIGVQAAAGFTTVSPGLLTWQDLFRPFTAFVPNLDPETLTRFIDTNTFYRRPDLDGEVSLDASGLSTFADQHVPSTGPLDGLGTVPSPTAWVTAARDEDGAYPDPERAHAIAETVYPALVDTYAEKGVTSLVLSDPWLTRHPDPETVLGSVDTLAEAASTDLELLLQLPFQDAGDVLATVGQLPVDGVIVDLTETSRETLGDLPGEAIVGLGLVDARSSLVERPDLLLSAVDGALDALDTDTVYLTPTGDLQHVPERIARRKVRILGETAKAAGEKLGGGA